MVSSQWAAPIAFLPAVLRDEPHSEPVKTSIVEEFYVVLPNGEVADGWLALPSHGEPRALVVMCHAFGGRAEDLRPFMDHLAREGAAVVAMEYRGPVGSFNIAAGVEDTVAATASLLEVYPSIEHVTIYGFSMGGAVAGLTVAAMPPQTFDYWVSGAGITDLAAIWNDVESFRPLIEAETGGTPHEVPIEYARRSPLRVVDNIVAANLSAVVMVHAHVDPVVSFDQARSLHLELRKEGVPALLVAVAGSDWPCAGAAPTCADSWPDLESHFVGHAPTVQPVLLGLMDGLWRPESGIIEVHERENLLDFVPPVMPSPSD